MKTKKEIAEEIFRLIGTELKSMEKMSREDLEKLLEILQSPIELVQVGMRIKKQPLEAIDDFLRKTLLTI